MGGYTDCQTVALELENLCLREGISISEETEELHTGVLGVRFYILFVILSVVLCALARWVWRLFKKNSDSARLVNLKMPLPLWMLPLTSIAPYFLVQIVYTFYRTCTAPKTDKSQGSCVSEETEQHKFLVKVCEQRV